MMVNDMIGGERRRWIRQLMRRPEHGPADLLAELVDDLAGLLLPSRRRLRRLLRDALIRL